MKEIEEFAKILIEKVRDAAIRSSDMGLKPNATDRVSERWREAARSGDWKAVAKAMIPDVVDETMFYLLRAIDDRLLKLSFTAPNGTQVDLCADGLGELSGWYMGSGGWRALYSKQRFVDDFSDLR